MKGFNGEFMYAMAGLCNMQPLRHDSPTMSIQSGRFGQIEDHVRPRS